jgi:hypothetical protein
MEDNAYENEDAGYIHAYTHLYETPSLLLEELGLVQDLTHGELPGPGKVSRSGQSQDVFKVKSFLTD